MRNPLIDFHCQLTAQDGQRHDSVAAIFRNVENKAIMTLAAVQRFGLKVSPANPVYGLKIGTPFGRRESHSRTSVRIRSRDGENALRLGMRIVATDDIPEHLRHYDLFLSASCYDVLVPHNDLFKVMDDEAGSEEAAMSSIGVRSPPNPVSRSLTATPLSAPDEPRHGLASRDFELEFYTSGWSDAFEDPGGFADPSQIDYHSLGDHTYSVVLPKPDTPGTGTTSEFPPLASHHSILSTQPTSEAPGQFAEFAAYRQITSHTLQVQDGLAREDENAGESVGVPGSYAWEDLLRDDEYYDPGHPSSPSLLPDAAAPGPATQAARREKSATIKEEDWGPWKAVLYNLYIIENLTLNGVVERMKKAHQFEATARQYRFRFGRWNFKKNVRAGEMMDAVHELENTGIHRDIVAGVRVGTKRMKKWRGKHKLKAAKGLG